ncbi:MAG: NAD-dependent epimerase/dehydratase family protein [Myxococcales bacterium]|nr:NAD-dependent epimerase/dehydratase family protein [Myxococcales bacterium]
MKVFLPGATGYIGSALAGALIRAGHQVTGLGRSQQRAAPLEARGLTFLRADLSDARLLEQEAKDHEVTVYAAAEYGPHRAERDAKAVAAILAGAGAGAGLKVFVYTSGVWAIGPTGERAADESTPVRPNPLVAWRPAVEKQVLEGASSKVRTQVVRPGVVYGGHGGYLGGWIRQALEEKRIRVVGDGKNRWPIVHLEDLAELFRLVIDRGAPRSVYHATDDTAHTVESLARVIARAAGIERVETWPLPEARAQLGPVAEALVMDQVVKSPASRRLGWKPRRELPSQADAVYDEYVAVSVS